MKYNLSNAIDIFKRAGIYALDIEHTMLSVTNREQTLRAGKTTRAGEEIELDGIAIQGKVIWLIEYTSSKNLDTGDFDNFLNKIHLLSDNNNILCDAIEKIWQKYKLDHTDKPSITDETVLLGLYISPYRNENQEETIKQRIPSKGNKKIFLWGRDTFEYFYATSFITGEHSQYELYSYFSLEPKYLFDAKEIDRQKSYIPHPFIDIKDGVFGCRMIIFKISPDALLSRAYVLRNEGWKSDSFQRMIIQEKLKNIREYIIQHKDASFANNIVVSLDPNIDSSILKETHEGMLLPSRFGSLCIIDGQHRLLAFTQNFYSKEDASEKSNDKVIKDMAEKEELIVTLLIFKGSPAEILRKQTQLFLDINVTQTKVKSDFIYNLKEIINIKAPESVGNRVLKYLSKRENGVFFERFSIKWYQGGRIKRSSLVQWGLVELLDPKKGVFYKIAPKKVKLEYDKGDIDGYVMFCANLLEKYFIAIRDVFKKRYPKINIWDFPAKSQMMFLSTSGIVGFLRLFRHFLFSKVKENDYKKYLNEIKVKFEKETYQFTSSQWAKLEEAMFDDIREKYGKFGDESLIKRA